MSTLTRRSVLTAAVGAAAAMRVGLPRALAQSATPTANDPLAGYPEINVTITDQALTISTGTVPAGYVLLTVINQSTEDTSAGVLGPGQGQSMADLLAAAATPVPDNGFPAFLYSATILGGPGDAPAGGTARAVVKIPAGDWVVFPEGNQPPAFFTATEGGGNQTEPASAVQVTEVDFAFGFDHAGIASGTQVWKVTNNGEQPHMLVMGGVPKGTTLAQLLEAYSRPQDATPPAGGLSEGDFRSVGGVIVQSSGQSVWTELTLDSGSYAASCFVNDENDPSMFHAMEGMIALFDVS